MVIDSYERLERFLREFRNWHGDPVPYDFVGVVTLLCALLDNIHANALDVEIEDFGETVSPQQAETLRKLVAGIPPAE